MRKGNPTNLNTRTYWNDVYATPEKREGYSITGTAHHHGPIQHMGQTSRFKKALEYVKDGDKVLDLGCGVGVFTKLVKDTYPNCDVYGCDISDVAMAANQEERGGITYYRHEIGRDILGFEDFFDVVFSGETLEHLDDPNSLLRDAHRGLKSGGKLIITTPNEDNIQSDEHTWIFTHEDIERLYVDNGFETPEFVYLPNMEHLMVIFAVGVKR